MNSIIERLNNKRILIFGYGREGKSTEEFIRKHVDFKALDIFEGKKEDIDEDKYDLIIKSPGIVMLENNPKYTSQTELFLDEYHGRTIGITGTKGKSTTSSMLAHVLNACGKKAILLGNIGKPCFDMIDEIEALISDSNACDGDKSACDGNENACVDDENSRFDDSNLWIVFELSCHQLLHINKAPHIAVFLNLFEEHLDYYGTMDNYFAAKANIISHQTAGDMCFTGANVPDIESDSARTVIYGPSRDYELSILGEHNKTNAEFVYRIAELICGGRPAPALSAIYEFKGLPHRLEYFAEKNGVKYYDDSISTIPEACINAIKSVPNAGTVIVGGMDRGIDYDILVEYIKETPEVLFILCYATGERIARELGSLFENVMLTRDLDNAVKLAAGNTEMGKACILSPAAPSYGYFKNFEERGEYFKELVSKLG